MTNEIKKRIEDVNNEKIPKGYCYKWHLMPVEWKDVPLSGVFSKSKQKNREKDTGVVFTNSAISGLIPQYEYFEKEIANEENTDGYYLVEKKDYVYNPRVSEYAPYGPFNRNDTGIVGIVSPLYTVLHPKEEYRECEYIRYYLESAQWFKYVYSVANCGARFDRMNISDKDLMELPICFPDMPEQKKIAEILHQCDKIIGLKKELIKAEKNKKKWLIEKFMNLGTTIEFKNCCLNKGEYGVNAPACEYQPELPQYIRITDIDDNGNYVKDCPVSVMTQEKEKYTLHEGDILFVRTGGTVGKPYRYVASDGELVFAGFLIRFSVNTCLFDDKFIYYQFLTSRYRNWVSTMSARSGQPGINAEEYGKYLLMVPSTIEEQRKIANIISASDEVIEKMEKELQQWKQKKKSLMQLLLTGIVRVNI